jgi:hypothetical protein
MQLVNSKEKKLIAPEIVVRAAEHTIEDSEHDMATSLAIVVTEMQMPTADKRQIGNTVFLAHKGTGKNKKKMVGRAFNMDTGRNFIENCLKYLTYLQRKGITHYSTSFDGEELLGGFKYLQRKVGRSDTEIGIARLEGGGYAVYIRVGKAPIPGS